MVALSTVIASNERISTELPSGLVAVIVGATSGIGEYTTKCLAKRATKPHIYLVGRSQSAGERVVAECQALNPDGQFTFISSDVGLIKNVDEVCQRIQEHESSLNILFMSQGSLLAEFPTSEDINLSTSLHYHGRMRFIQNLLPLLENAPALRRVVSVFAGGLEGKILTDNFQARDLGLITRRNHISAMVTLGLETMAHRAPSVSFIHEFPGPVHTPGVNTWPGALGIFIRFSVFLFGRFFCVPQSESAERHLYLATSALYAPASGGADVAGVPVVGDLEVVGTSGATGEGVYSLSYNGEAGGPKSRTILAAHREAGMEKKLEEYIEAEFSRITGK